MLTPSQQTALVANILLDPVLALAPHNSDGAIEVANAYSALATPVHTVWATGVPGMDLLKGLNWSEYISRSAGEREALALMTRMTAVNFGNVNIRDGILNAFSGVGAAPVAARASLFAIGQRSSKRAEKLFATGTGTPASPATMTFEGNLTPADVAQAWGISL